MMLKLPYNPQITKNQHFVPSHFLNAWCSDGMLWVSNKDFKLFQQKAQNVAKSKGIYSLDYMTADEFIENFSNVTAIAKKINPELFRIIMDGMVSNLLYKEICEGQLTRDDFNRIMAFIEERGLCSNAEVTLLRFVWAIYENGYVPEDIKNFCEKHFVEGLEPFVTRVEQVAYPLIEMLRNGDSAFLADPEKRETLFLYIALQMFRVKKFTDIAKQFGVINPKTLKLARPILVARTVNYLVHNWDNEVVDIVDNATSLEFITGDNPLCNLDAHYKIRHLDLFFPISPSKAVFICAKDRRLIYPEMSQITIQFVHELNRKIAAGSSYQVFAKERDTLYFGGYKPSFDPKSVVVRS